MTRSDLVNWRSERAVAATNFGRRELSARERLVWTILFFAVLLCGRALFGALTGAFFFPPYSDALSHFQIAQAWYEMATTFRLTPDLLARAYAEGTWPPLWHICMAIFMLIFGDTSVVAVTFALLVNTVACALVAFSFGRTTLSFLVAAVVLSLSPIILIVAFQTRPENVVFLLIAAFLSLAARLFERWRLAEKPTFVELVFFGLIMAALFLSHASTIFIIGAALILLGLGSFSMRRYLIAVAVALALMAPWEAALIGSNSNLPIGSTSSSLNLLIGNNPYLDEDLGNWGEAKERAVALAKQRATADPIRFRRPFLVPKSYYDKWLALQNEQYQMRLIAIRTIKDDPVGFLKRAVFRFWLFLEPGSGPSDNPMLASTGFSRLVEIGRLDGWVALILSLAAGGAAWRRRADRALLYPIVFLAGAWLPIIFILPLHRLMLPIEIIALSVIVQAIDAEMWEAARATGFKR